MTDFEEKILKEIRNTSFSSPYIIAHPLGITWDDLIEKYYEEKKKRKREND